MMQDAVECWRKQPSRGSPELDVLKLPTYFVAWRGRRPHLGIALLTRHSYDAWYVAMPRRSSSRSQPWSRRSLTEFLCH